MKTIDNGLLEYRYQLVVTIDNVRQECDGKFKSPLLPADKLPSQIQERIVSLMKRTAGDHEMEYAIDTTVNFADHYLRCDGQLLVDLQPVGSFSARWTDGE